MSPQPRLDTQSIVARAKALLGRDAEMWLYRENRNLASLAPFEMAQSSAGALIVLRELERITRIDGGDVRSQ
jgi:hypothetical protein